jgi:aminodeoxyfutalosine synthase
MSSDAADLKTGPYSALFAKIDAGERLSTDELDQLASTPDIIAIGMLADEARRRVHGARVTYIRVAVCPFDQPLTDAVPPAAREVRLTGAPPSIEVAVTAVSAARSVAGNRAVSAFSFRDLEALAKSEGVALKRLLGQLRTAGLDAVADVPLDRVSSPDSAVDALANAGFERVRLTVDKPAASDRMPLLRTAAAIQDRLACVQAISPLPMVLTAFGPTTGYEDVKMVALARLTAPNIATVQVDWQRYGPKLAQVALTFGADDIDNVSPSDDAPEGRRRAPLEEVRRNIEAAGFTPAERDGFFALSNQPRALP